MKHLKREDERKFIISSQARRDVCMEYFFIWTRAIGNLPNWLKSIKLLARRGPED